MDVSTFWSSLVSPSTPWLPSPSLTPWALHAAWALVAGAAASTLLARQLSNWRWGLTLGIMAWCMQPGEISPAHWLGLAFQMPSLSSVVLCLMLLWRHHQMPATRITGQPATAWKLASLAGIILGWVLLLDTLAWTPISIYAWGFSPTALGVGLMLLLLFWALWGGSDAQRSMPLTLACVLALYGLTRLPSGNVWDALLDPWLWLLLQWQWLHALTGRLLKAWRLRATTRA